jgi:uncharacterized hydrophobic protein (TIGR00271 family)
MPDQQNDLAVTSATQYRTAQELIERSGAGATYYLLLTISSVIVASGLLIGNATIVIGGMLVAPVLTPLLAISLGFSIGDMTLIKRTSILLLKSFAIVFIASLVMAVVLGADQTAFNLENDVRSAILYFIVALAAGAAATVAWTRKEVSDILPGVAIAVALVPPVGLVGIWLSMLNFEAARFYFAVFLLNLFGIIIGSLVIFVMLKFYKAEEKIHKKVVAEVAAAAAAQAAAEKAKAAAAAKAASASVTAKSSAAGKKD